MNILDVEIENRFGFHPATNETGPKFDRNRKEVKTLATYFRDHLPDCREASTAMTKLDEALMHANAAIARMS